MLYGMDCTYSISRPERAGCVQVHFRQLPNIAIALRGIERRGHEVG